MSDLSVKARTIRAPKLGWFLVFAVVYADIGTSIFYVPAILYLSIGNLATLAQIITTGVFISIALKYVEICERCPDGGGVVSIVRQAFGTLTYLPLLGGSLITVDYFLTSAISGVSGVYYLASIIPGSKFLVVPMALGILFLLMILNIIGLRESAAVTAWFSGYKVIVTLILIVAGCITLTEIGGWSDLIHGIFHPGVPLSLSVLAIGYADTWLAYSGLESAAQVSGSMRQPVKRTASVAMWWVIVTIALFSPIITAMSLHLVPEEVKHADPEALLAMFAFQTGGTWLKWLTVLASTTLLFMACNTAMVGNYHVNVRMADLGFLPSTFRKRHPKFNTPFISIVISALVPMAVLIATGGSIAALGDLYAFGLLGTLTLSSIAVDRLRWRDGIRGMKFWGGVGTSVAVAAAWLINCVHKWHALVFGGSIAVLMIIAGMLMRRKAASAAELEFAVAEARIEDMPEAAGLVTLDEAVDAHEIEGADSLVSIRYANPKLLTEAARFVKGGGQSSIYIVYVDEMPGLFTPPDVKPSIESRKILYDAVKIMQAEGISAIPVWRLAEDAGRAVADAARHLEVKTVFVGSSKRNFLWRMLKGRVLKRLAEGLPEACDLIIVG